MAWAYGTVIIPVYHGILVSNSKCCWDKREHIEN